MSIKTPPNLRRGSFLEIGDFHICRQYLDAVVCMQNIDLQQGVRRGEICLFYIQAKITVPGQVGPVNMTVHGNQDLRIRCHAGGIYGTADPVDKVGCVMSNAGSMSFALSSPCAAMILNISSLTGSAAASIAAIKVSLFIFIFRPLCD